MKSLTFSKFAGEWLNAPPIQALDLHFSDREFSLAIRYRLGMEVLGREIICPACKVCTSDKFGHHAANCKKWGSVSKRHNSIRDIIFSTMNSGGIGVEKEKAHLFDNSNERPGDIFVPHWIGLKSAAFDVTITNPLNVKGGNGTPMEEGVAAGQAEESKRKKYDVACNVAGIKFEPFALETYGAFGPNAKVLLNRISRFIARNKNQEKKTVKKRLAMRISVSLQRRMAKSFLERDPCCFEDDY